MVISALLMRIENMFAATKIGGSSCKSGASIPPYLVE
jgi:hypothetical protein